MVSSFLFSAPRAWTFISLIAFFVFIPCIYSFPLAAATDEGAGSTSYVLTLDATNFSEVVAKNRFVVVEFYAPWCGHCKRLAPEYEKAAVTLSKHDPPILLAKVDANDEGNKDLASKYGIRGYPTIKIFRDEAHNIQEYKGPLDADGIVEYLTKQAGPASVEITSSEDAKKFIDENKIFIVGIFSKFSGEEFDNFITVAEKLRSDYDFGHTLETKFLPKGVYNVEKPVVRLMKPFDELFVDSQDFRLESLEEFIAKASTPLVTLFTKDPNNHPYVKNFFSSGNAKAMLFLNFSSENVGDFKLKYKEVAENFRNKNISFLLGDIDSSQSAFRFFGLREEQVPLIIVQASDGQKFLKANLNPKDIGTWFKGYMDGNLKPYRKSESIPDLNNDPVKVIVADNIGDVVFNSGKNVFVELYAPWCGHCQKLAPILDDVAVSFVNDPSVVIAKMDATANDVPRRFKIEGFPTLYLSTPSGSLLQYNGRRTKEDIVEFIQKHRESTMEPDSLKDEL